MQCNSESPTFRKNISTPFSESKGKRSWASHLILLVCGLVYPLIQKMEATISNETSSSLRTTRRYGPRDRTAEAPLNLNGYYEYIANWVLTCRCESRLATNTLQSAKTCLAANSIGYLHHSDGCSCHQGSTNLACHLIIRRHDLSLFSTASRQNVGPILSCVQRVSQNLYLGDKESGSWN
jgi:hypothetical protein